MGQKELVLPKDIAFTDLKFRYNPASGGFSIDLGAMLYFCDANDIDACSVMPCSLDASNPDTASILECSRARLQALLNNWYSLHCARSGVRDIAYESWLRRGEPRKKSSRLEGISKSLPFQPIS